MIFDIKDAFLIAGGLIFTVFFFVDYLTKNDLLDDEPCTHTFIKYQSTGKKTCIDCGYSQDITEPHYPKHQR
jgi:hypothetical protein